ncbi:MAG: 4Fe-4S dicluster domain-containing protein [Kiritimatiellae bacterium]|nr:4Fe-4S dicluster domain-containing protein [Kiritimatiellia bacterium]
MNEKTIKKDDIGKLLRALEKDRTVYAPISDDKCISLSRLSPDSVVTLEYENFKMSAKNFFFPQCEVLCTFRQGAVCDVPVPDEKFVLFGVRPCDARSLMLMDKLFGEFGKSKDPYYLQRRENSVVITLACSSPCSTCFCTSVGGSPTGKDGADIVVFETGNKLLFDPQTSKGEKLMNSLSEMFAPATRSDLSARNKIVQDAEKMIETIDLTGLEEKLKNSFDSPVWDSISKICLGCGLCTHQCPTCHCFDMTDEEDGAGSGRRIRTWDSCQFSLFTLHASGHNPRTRKTHRMRQRILHKFLYTVDNLNEVFCVGCGRCVRNCPINLDLREALRRLRSEENK